MTSAPVITLVQGLRDRGFHVVLEGEDLRLGPAARVTPKVREWVYRNHAMLVDELLAEPISSPVEARRVARRHLNPKGVDYGPAPVGQAPPGRDPLAHQSTDKAKFFRGAWREAWPKGFRAHKEVSGSG